MQNLADLMARLAPGDGMFTTRLPGVRMYRKSEHQRREPLLYEQGIILVAQGTKRLFLDGAVYDFNAENYLTLAVSVPVECETIASPEEPLLAMAVDIDLGLLHEIIETMEASGDLEKAGGGQERQHGVFVSPVTPQVYDVARRLVLALYSPTESNILGPGCIKELLFRIMESENSAILHALVRQSSNIARVDKALRVIHAGYRGVMTVEDLASLVNMSPSTFHRAFKDATASTPIQYVKKFRLNKAKTLLQVNGLRVNEAASEVGYESTAQFSREFKRYFGQSPVTFIHPGQE